MAVTLQAPAPQVEIGYAQAVNYNWWLYENETTPELVWPQSTFVFDSMRRTDSQVTSVLRAMTLPVRRTPWRIDPNGARPEVVKFVADDLGLPVVGQKAPTPPPRSKDRFSWPDHLRQALLMLSYGHMYFEQVYRVDPDGSAAHLRKLAPRMPKTIERIDVAADGGLISIKQYWSSTNSAQQTIPVNRLVAYIHEREGGNWLGTSILRPAYKNWLLKDRLLRVQAQTIERNGMGIPLYKAAEGATEMATGLAMAKAWRAGDAAGSAVPFGADLILRGVEGTLPDAEPAVRYHDEQIGRAVLAHFLNLGTQTGSWALGTTFADFFTLSLQTLADQVADTATQHIVEDLVDINFGDDEPAPRIVCDEIGSRQAATAEALASLIDSGVIRPDEVLEESSRQQYGLPPADPKTTRTPPAPGGGQPPIPTDGSPTPGDVTPTDGTADATVPDASAAVAAMQGVAAAARPDDDPPPSAGTPPAGPVPPAPPAPPAPVAAKFNPDEPRLPDGRWGVEGSVGDALKLAGKIDLEPGETLVGSSKVKADMGTVRMAVTEQHGHRSVRLGIGDVMFGGRDDQAGPWRGGRDDLRDRNSKADVLTRERDRLEAEHDTLAAARDPLVAKYKAGSGVTPAEHAELERLTDRRDEIANRLDEIDDEDTDVVDASGYTTKLDAPQIQQLHAALADLMKQAKDATPAHEAAWDALPDGSSDVPATYLRSGSVPGAWGDVHFSGYLDEPEMGPQFELAVVPHGMTLADVRDADTHASLDAREVSAFLRQLAKAGGIQAKARPVQPPVDLLGEDVDEQADAITAALDEWVDSQLPADVEAKFNPDELRIPGGKGGGRWTKNPIGKAISDALDAWSKGKGPDDPFTFDGKPIDREPLRRAAVARGITLKRGASRDDIVAALLGGVREEVKTQRAERQKRLGSSKFSIDVGGTRSPHLRTTEPPVTSSSTLIVPTPTPPNPQSPWGKVRDRPTMTWSEVSGRPGPLDQVDRVYTAPTREDARKFLASMDEGRLQDVADQVEDIINIRGLTAERNRETLIDRLVDGIREPEGAKVGGKRIDVAVYTGTDPNAPSLREISSANRPGRLITSQPDLAGLEKWANDHGHTDVAQWAAGERARKEAKSAPKPAKAAKKATPTKKATTEAVGVPQYTPPESVTPADRDRAAKLIERDPQIFATVQDRFGGVSTSGNLSREDAAWLQGLFEREPAFVNHLAQDAQIRRYVDRNAQRAGETPEAYRERVGARLKALLADKPIVTRVPDEAALVGILDGGRFRTSNERGTKRAPGLVSSPGRKLGEEILGTPRDTPAEQRPVYGYVAVGGIEPALGAGRKIPGISQREGQEDVLSTYGQVQVVLKPEVRGRTTATVGDSLDEIGFMRPSPVDKPSADSLGVHKLEDIGSPGWTRRAYVEAQVHGGVTAADIDHVVFVSEPSPAVVAKLDEHGIDWQVLDANGVSKVPAKKAASKAAKSAPSAPAKAPATKRVPKAVKAAPKPVAELGAAIRQGGGEGEIVRLLNAHEMTPSQLRDLAVGLDIHVPADMRSRQRIELHIAHEASLRFGAGDGRLADRAPKAAPRVGFDSDAVAERLTAISDTGDAATATQKVVAELEGVTSLADLRRVAGSLNLPLAKDRKFTSAQLRQHIAETVVRDRTRWTLGGDARLRQATPSTPHPDGLAGGARPKGEGPTAIRSSAPGPHRYRHGWIPTDPLADMSDDELLDHFHNLSQADTVDEDALRAIDAELERREGMPFDSPESRRVDEMVARGHGYLDAYAEVHGLDVQKLEREQRMQRVDRERRSGETRAQTIRRMHAEHVALAVLQAEDDTRGNLLSREGRAKGIDPATLWSGPSARARKYASDELKRWWSEHGGRMTAAQYAAQFTGDAKAVEAARLAGQGKDFGV